MQTADWQLCFSDRFTGARNPARLITSIPSRRSRFAPSFLQFQDTTLRAPFRALSDRAAQARRDAESAFPGVGHDVEGTAYWSWQKDPWQRAAFIEYLPGQAGELLEVLPQPEGRIHFAGEHTARFAGWMHCALESGRRAAREIFEGVRD